MADFHVLRGKLEPPTLKLFFYCIISQELQNKLSNSCYNISILNDHAELDSSILFLTVVLLSGKHATLNFVHQGLCSKFGSIDFSSNE